MTLVRSVVTAIVLGAAISIVLASSSSGEERSSLEVSLGPTTAPILVETKAERDRRMKWWREARFGMFIHWGLYAVPAGEYKGQRSEIIGAWMMEWANMARVEYEKFTPQSNPVKFNAAERVRIAKDAGMK